MNPLICLATVLNFALLAAAQTTPNASSTSSQTPNEVTYVDLKIKDNTARHRTSAYKQNERPFAYDPYGYSMVVRRGEPLELALHFRRPFDNQTDRVRLEFSLGSEPKLDKGTLTYLPISADPLPAHSAGRRWWAQLAHWTPSQLHLQVSLPANMAVGVWRLKISTKFRDSRNLRSFAVNRLLYVLFNSWNLNDPTYMAREDARQEYVLSEVGKIYIGSSSRPSGRKWTYGQFHEAVLPAVMYMLDKSRLDVAARADVVRVSRAVSALVNSHDDNGILVGNWSGNYDSGLAPWQWTGSATIFERFLRSGGRPVRYGQCWVFGGVTTSALRTLGIPARTITNFVSAHDTDLSLTVDEFYSEFGEKLTGINGDSIWNFHVWSDAWMARNDLPAGYGGWQAIDATPQEVSMGMYQLGPASLEAIKQGRVNYAYDVGFVYSEVNADLVRWNLDGRAKYQWRKSTSTTNHVGRKMYTKMIGLIDERSFYGVDDAENIVEQYKYPEGSREERLAFAEATRAAGLRPILDNR